LINTTLTSDKSVFALYLHTRLQLYAVQRYRQLINWQVQGADVSIVGSEEERMIVPLLRQALQLPN
jgi:hypothetical protein